MEAKSEVQGTVEENVEIVKFSGRGKRKQRVKRNKFRRYLPHVLVGVIVMGTLRVVFNSIVEWPTAVQLHVIFAVVGFQALMGHGILIIRTMAYQDAYVFPNADKKKFHWISTAVGTVFALTGNAIIYNSKEQHFDTTHGILGLVAALLTLWTAFNGTIFLYFKELGIGKRQIRFGHTLTGAVTFILSSICLVLGYNKEVFIGWTSAPYAYGLTAVCVLSLGVFIRGPGRVILNHFKNKDEHNDEIKDKED